MAGLVAWILMLGLLMGISVHLASPAVIPSLPDTHISLVLNTDALEAEDTAPVRTKRSLTDDLGDLSVDELMDDLPAIRRGLRNRVRRSAAWWLHATIQLCTTHGHLCKRIEVREGDVKFALRMEVE